MRQPEHLAAPGGLPGAGGQVPEVPGILSAALVAQTGRAIAAGQQADGSIGWPDGHVDAWNHIECAMALSVCGLREEARRAYAWLASAQQPDGSWPVQAACGGVIEEWTTESNHAAYCAVGIWHELLVTGDEEFAAQMWPAVRAAVAFVTGLQTPRGEIIWRRHEDGTPDGYALLTGSSSMYQSLRCAIALAERMGEPQPDWELAAAQLGHVVACHPEAFADKSRFSMDWYYPVLGGAVRGAAAESMLKAGWDTFVVPGLGVRCVSDEPWVTAAETCELAIALEATGRRDQALELFEQIQFLRAGDGSYWTGWQFENGKHYPHEQSSYTAAAVVLAADVLAGGSGPAAPCTGAAGIFRAGAACPAAGSASCGCAAGSPSVGPDAGIASRGQHAGSG
ncbi:MAG: prenyltransferase [Streptosporangiaceae bacterium]